MNLLFWFCKNVEAGARVLSAPRAALAVVNGDLNFCLFFYVAHLNLAAHAC